MHYLVIYQLPDGTTMAQSIPAANDSEMLQRALQLMPPGASIDTSTQMPEAA